MSKNFLRVAMASLVLTAGVAAWVPAAAEEGPQITKALAKPLKAALDSVNAKNWDFAISQLKEVQASAEKSPFDTFVINQLLAQSYVQKKDYASASTPIAAIIDSPYVGSNLPLYLRQLVAIKYQMKEWPDVVEYGNRLMKTGETGEDLQTNIAYAYYFQNKYKDALTGLQAVISSQEKAGKKPDESSLRIQLDCYTKLNDNAGASRAMDKLVSYYPKPEYMQSAVLTLVNSKDGGDRFKLSAYRLAFDLGLLKVGGSYTEMAQIDLDQGLPGEARQVLEQAIAKKLFTEERDQQRNGRLMDNATKQATADKAQLAAGEKSAAALPTGDALVQMGVAYMTYGDYAKAVTLINQGIQKGGLKNNDEAYLQLGVANYKARNLADAAKAFDKVSDNSVWGRLAKLWAVRK